MQSDRHKRQCINYYCERPIRYKLDDNQSNAEWRWALENIQAQLFCLPYKNKACPGSQYIWESQSVQRRTAQRTFCPGTEVALNKVLVTSLLI